MVVDHRSGLTIDRQSGKYDERSAEDSEPHLVSWVDSRIVVFPAPPISPDSTDNFTSWIVGIFTIVLPTWIRRWRCDRLRYHSPERAGRTRKV